MATTYTQIGSTVTVGAGGAASIDFTSIPSTYTDLLIKLSLRTDTTASSYADVGVQFNSTSSGYSYKTIAGNGATVQSFGGTSQAKIFDIWTNTNSNTSNTFTSAEIYIPNYAGSNQKSINIDGTSENNATNAYQTMSAGLSNITSAITSISINAAYNFVQYSTASLYGIKKY